MKGENKMTTKNYVITFKIGTFPELKIKVEADSENEARKKAYDIVIQEHPELKDKPINETGAISSECVL
jgi:hypothetical protein